MSNSDEATTGDHEHSPTTQEPGTGLEFVRDNLYFLDTVTFLIEGTMFKVPMHAFLSASDHIRSAVIAASQGDDEAALMLSLAEVTRVDFKALLKVLYPLDLLHSGMFLSVSEWTAVLRLGTRWGLKDVCKLAANTLAAHGSDQPVERPVPVQELNRSTTPEPAHQPLDEACRWGELGAASPFQDYTMRRVLNMRHRGAKDQDVASAVNFEPSYGSQQDVHDVHTEPSEQARDAFLHQIHLLNVQNNAMEKPSPLHPIPPSSEAFPPLSNAAQAASSAITSPAPLGRSKHDLIALLREERAHVSAANKARTAHDEAAHGSAALERATDAYLCATAALHAATHPSITDRIGGSASSAPGAGRAAAHDADQAQQAAAARVRACLCAQNEAKKAQKAGSNMFNMINQVLVALEREAELSLAMRTSVTGELAVPDSPKKSGLTEKQQRKRQSVLLSQQKEATRLRDASATGKFWDSRLIRDKDLQSWLKKCNKKSAAHIKNMLAKAMTNTDQAAVARAVVAMDLEKTPKTKKGKKVKK